MAALAEYIGYTVIIIGLLLVGLFMIMKIMDYIPTPRKWLYKKISQLAQKEPDVFLNMIIFLKRKYKLKYKSKDIK